MRRTILVLLVFVAFAIVSLALAQTPITITNPNFIDDIDGWSLIEECVTNTWIIDGATDQGSLLLSGEADACGLYQNVYFTTTMVYTVMLNVKSNGYLCYANLSDGSSGTISTDWETVSFTAMIYGDNSYALSLYTLDNDALCYFDNIQVFPGEIPETPTPTPTPTPGTPSAVTLVLSSGQSVDINYSYTFGEMAIIVVLIALVVLIAMRFVYDVTLQVFNSRRAGRDTIDDGS